MNQRSTMYIGKKVEMAKIKVSELQGAALDWAVLTAHYTDGHEVVIASGMAQVETTPGSGVFSHQSPSTDWAQGGQIIEQERIKLARFDQALLDDVGGDNNATAADYLLVLEMIFHRLQEQANSVTKQVIPKYF